MSSPALPALREMQRVPVGAYVEIRGGSDLGVGRVTGHITETHGGIPLIGWVKAIVEFPADDIDPDIPIVERIKTTELRVVG